MINRKFSIYTSPTCRYCLQLKKWFNDNNLAYEEISVIDMDNEQLKSEITGVPYTIVFENNEVVEKIIGFSERKFYEKFME